MPHFPAYPLRFGRVMPAAPAIVVLGCKVALGGAPSAALARRIELAARAHGAGLAPRIIASGGRRWGPHVEAVVIKRELARAGIAAEAITMELCSLNTIENCCFTAELLRELGGSSVWVASCRWHLPRVVTGFRRFGIEALTPPAAWLTTPPASAAVHIRERLCAWADSCKMPRRRI